MNRDEAIEALALLRKVVSQTRDDTVLQNWGLIWIVQGLTNAVGFAVTNVMIWNRWPLWSYPSVWAAIISFNLAVSFLLKSRSAGARSFVESQIYSIWFIFVGAVVLIGCVNHLMGLEAFRLAPVIAVLASAALATMSTIMGSRFLVPAAAAAATAVLMTLFPEWQFFILGGSWGAFQISAGLILDRERRRRVASGASAATLV